VLFALEGARIVARDIDGDGLNGLREGLQAQGAEVVVVQGGVAEPDEARSMIGAAVEAYERAARAHRARRPEGSGAPIPVRSSQASPAA
jgi:hypothetical protein